MKKLVLSDILENTSDLSKQKKVGYIAIIGRPNVGKSTFLNTLIGEKISITTNVPQTTRKRVLGIYNDEDSQIVFFDTPGIHKSDKFFNEQINEVAIQSLNDADLILYFIDSSRKPGAEEEYVVSLLAQTSTSFLKVYTKSDLHSLLPTQRQEDDLFISSQTKDGFSVLLEKMKEKLPLSHLLFPEDLYTKQDMYFRISEIIREKLFLYTKEELPHSAYVGVEEIDDGKDILKMVAYIYVESDSQKYIVVGKAGVLITKIGKEARIELEKIFGKKVFLALRVKVRKNWRKNESLIKKILF